jgi:hypothetical protein
MLNKSTFSVNKNAIIIWLTLAMTSTLYIVLFAKAFVIYIKYPKNPNTLAKAQIHDPNHLYEAILIQPLAIRNQNQALLQELDNVRIQHHTNNCNSTQIRLIPQGGKISL